MAAHKTQVRVRYAHTDQSGVVYHTRYIEWFEAGRSDAMREHGMPYSEIESLGILLPVIEVYARYHKPAVYEQLLDIWTYVGELTRTRIRFDYRITLAEQNEPLVTGYTVHPFISKDNKVLRLDRMPELWQRLQEAARELSYDAVH